MYRGGAGFPESDPPRLSLPAGLRLLCVSQVEPSWTMLALLLDRHGCHEPQFRWCASYRQALAALRDETFDCTILCDDATRDAAAFLEAVAADGGMEPVLVVTAPGDDEWLAAVCACECEVLVTPAGWQSAALPVWISRTIERAHIARENLRLTGADRRRTLRERDETEQLLEQQRRILREHSPLCDRWDVLREARSTYDSELDTLPPDVLDSYRELLRTYVMMGSGGLAGEIRKLAQLLALAGVGPGTALHVHLARVQELIRGLGSRSSRYVMARADLLAMELMIELGECYRRKSERRGLGDFGIDLLHEESLRQKRERPD